MLMLFNNYIYIKIEQPFRFLLYNKRKRRKKKKHSNYHMYVRQHEYTSSNTTGHVVEATNKK